MTGEHLKREADRLKHDELFNKALDAIRSEALNNLATANADSFTDIVSLQQRVAVIDEIRATLDRYVLQGGREDDTAASPYA